MADIDIWYAKNDRFLLDIRGHDLVVDQPRDSGGDDVGPTPTELFVASVGACIGYYAERYLRRHDLPVEGLRIRAGFQMSDQAPARVAGIEVRVSLPEGIPSERLPALEAVMDRCTVHNSLRWPPEVRVAVEVAEPATA